MSQLLEQAFAAVSALSQTEQDAIAHDILQKIKSRKISRTHSLKFGALRKSQAGKHRI